MELLLVQICISYSITVINLERCVEICFHFVAEGSLSVKCPQKTLLIYLY